MLDFCRNNGITIIGHSIMTKGHKLNNHILIDMARKYGITVGNLMISWCYHNNVIPLVTNTTQQFIIENSSINNITIHDDDIVILKGLESGYKTHKQYD